MTAKPDTPTAFPHYLAEIFDPANVNNPDANQDNETNIDITIDPEFILTSFEEMDAFLDQLEQKYGSLPTIDNINSLSN